MYNNCYNNNNNNTNEANHFVDIHLNTNANLEQRRYGREDDYQQATKSGGNFDSYRPSSLAIAQPPSIDRSDCSPNVTVEHVQLCNGQIQSNKNESSTNDVADVEHIKRPMNGFMVFSQHRRKQLACLYPTMHNANISKILGDEWKAMGQDDKKVYMMHALTLQKQHSINHPGYKYKPKRRKNNINDTVTKRRLESGKKLPDSHPRTDTVRSLLTQRMTQIAAHREQVEPDKLTPCDRCTQDCTPPQEAPVMQWYSVFRDIYDLNKDEFDMYLPKYL